MFAESTAAIRGEKHVAPPQQRLNPTGFSWLSTDAFVSSLTKTSEQAFQIIQHFA